jgi:hypothetical protein
MDKYIFIAGLAFCLAGLAFFIKSILNKNKYTGIGYKEFISTRYFVADVPLGRGVKKKLLLRELDIKDIVEISDMPNWFINIEFKGKDAVEKAKSELKDKTEQELLDQTKKFYSMMQNVAERAIVKWSFFAEEWKNVDPEYNGKFDKETLDWMFERYTNEAANVIKKKNSYDVLQSLAKIVEKVQATTSKG